MTNLIVDCHNHILDPLRFPYGAENRFHPDGVEINTAENFARLMAANGVSHALIVGPNSGYGLDNAALLDAVADSVAAYHLALPPARGVDPSDAMRLVALGNGRSALEAGLPPAGVRDWLDAMTKRLDTLAGWLDARGREGFVRRAHGDLHLGNMCL